jgi:hypothetical protein
MGDRDEDTTCSRLPWHLLACGAVCPRLYGGGNHSVSAAGEIAMR